MTQALHETVTLKLPASDRFTLLQGHTDFESAHLVNDYPSGRGLRTQVKFWLETAMSGPKEDQTRLMTCTRNPKTGHWNKPHAGTYSHIKWLYRDERDGHVHAWVVDIFSIASGIARFKAVGLWQQLTGQQQAGLDQMDMLCQKWTGETNQKWDETVERVRDAAKLHGYHSTDLYEAGGFAAPGEKWVAEPKFADALALVKVTDLGELTLPAPY